jgi:hypothetical protein
VEDRQEFARGVHEFLAHLRLTVAADAGATLRAKLDALARAPGDEVTRLLAVQVTLARELPDYWERFAASRASFLPPGASGGERRGLLRRLFGGG